MAITKSVDIGRKLINKVDKEKLMLEFFIIVYVIFGIQIFVAIDAFLNVTKQPPLGWKVYFITLIMSLTIWPALISYVILIMLYELNNAKP